MSRRWVARGLLLLTLATCGCARDHGATHALPPSGAPLPTSASVDGVDSGAVASSTTHPAAPTPSPPTATAPATTQPPTHRLTLYLQPLGEELPEADVAFVERSLHAFYELDVRRLERLALPDSAKNLARTRYRAERLLELLAERMPEDGDRILGLTAVDISTTKGDVADWGILGLASIDGATCVLSKFRTGRGARTREQAQERLGKVAVHELGHTLGLEHCPTLGCLMEDARGTVLTCDREVDLCPRCRAALAERGYSLRDEAAAIPWSR